jgi:hypothetical protein
MKKLSLLILTVCLLMPFTAQAAEYMSITKMRETAPDRWVETYKTKWRTIEVDAEIRLPDTETVPILKVGYPNREPEQGWTIAEYGGEHFLQTDIEGWDEVESRPDAFVLYNYDKKTVPRKVDGKQINKDAEAAGQWYSGFAPENTYIPMCDITYGELCDMIRAELTRFGYDAKDFRLEMPNRLWAHHWYLYGYKKDVLPGYIMLEAAQKLHGLPYLSHIQQAVSDGDSSYVRWYEPSLLFCGIYAGYDGYQEQMAHIFVENMEILETPAEDVPLCSIDKVIRAIEPMIEKGNIRKVYEITLGYVGYNEPGTYRTKSDDLAPTDMPTYYFKPAWQVNCLYLKSATGKLRETASYTTDERNSLDYKQFIVDAQTGKLIEESRAQDRCEYTGFISWEKAGGKAE